MNLTFFQTHLFSCVHPATAEQRCLGRWGGLLELVSSPVPPLRAGCRPPLLSACLPVRLPACLSPLVPWRSPRSAPDEPWRAQKAALLQNMSRAGERGGGCGFGEKGNVQKHRPPRPSRRRTPRPPRDVKTGCQAAADRTSQSLEMCLPVWGEKKKVGVAFWLGDMLLKH